MRQTSSVLIKAINVLLLYLETAVLWTRTVVLLTINPTKDIQSTPECFWKVGLLLLLY